MADRSLPVDYFDAMFSANPDPWAFETSPYEAEKYSRSLAALGGRRYRNALEVGCANGVFTGLLTDHCDRVLALDISKLAIELAARRCGGKPNVAFSVLEFPAKEPTGAPFDLVVISEVAYYWSDADLVRAGNWLMNGLARGGDLLLVHWTGETDYPQTADGAVEKLAAALAGSVTVERTERRSQYRLDLWRAL